MPSSAGDFSVVQQETARRFSDLRKFWSAVKVEEVSPPGPQPFSYLVGTGFTVVYLYSILEFSINRSVKQLSELITGYSVKMKDVSSAMMCLVHDPKVNAIKASGKKSKLSARLGLFMQIRGSEFAKVHDELLSQELQNVWAKSIEETFQIFGIECQPLSDAANGIYIDKIVNDRNAVAHGREPPEVVGSNYTSAQMDDLIFRVERETQYVVDRFKVFYDNREFIDNSCRYRYIKRDEKEDA